MNGADAETDAGAGPAAERQLRLIRQIVGVADALGIEIWLRGGWAMDFCLGRVTRPHRDVDWFIWAADADALSEALVEVGYLPTPGPPLDQQREFTADGEDVQFALLARNGGDVVVAGGPWAGAPWPSGMLEAAPGQIGDLRCPVIAPAAQIEIKQMMPVWNPALARRDKDRADIELLKTFLRSTASEPQR